MSENRAAIDWPIVGNEHITGFLTERIARGTAEGVYLFTGPSDVGKHTAAVFFARLLLCQGGAKSERLPCGECPACRRFAHEDSAGAADGQYSLASDFYTLRRQPDKKEITVEDTRQFINDLSHSSFLNGYKVGIIHEADALSEESANALLKTLEEPKRQVVIILVARSAENLLPTIVSRCQTLVFRLVSAAVLYDRLLALGASRSDARLISRLAFGRPALAAKLQTDREWLETTRRLLRTFWGLNSAVLADRLEGVADMLGSAAADDRRLPHLLELWEAAARESLISPYGRAGLLELPEFAGSGEAMDQAAAIAALDLIGNVRRWLAANENPRTALEGLAVCL